MVETPVILKKSKELVLRWGDSMVERRSLRDWFTIGDVSLWDLSAPYLAVNRIPQLIDPQGNAVARSLKKILRDFARLNGGGLLHLWRDRSATKHQSDAACRTMGGGYKKCLFLNFQPVFYSETFASVAEKLCESKKIKAFVLGEEVKTCGLNENSNIVFHSIFGHYSEAVDQRFRDLYYRQYRKQKKQLKRVLQQVVGQLWPCLKLDAEWLLRVEYPRLIKRMCFAEHVLDLHRPDIIISPDDADQATRIYTLLAKKRRIPTIVLQQGLAGEKSVEWGFVASDKAVVFGEHFKEVLVEHGVPESKICIGGWPRLRGRSNCLVTEQAKLKQKMNINAGEKVVLLASQPNVPGAFGNSSDRRSALLSLRDVVQEVKGIHLVIKAHPVEKEAELKNIFGTANNITYIRRNEDIHKCVLLCDVMVTFFSTAGLLALVEEKPLICMQYGVGGPRNPYLYNRVALKATNKIELKNHLLALCDPSWHFADNSHISRFVDSWIYKMGWAADERICNIINATIDGVN